MDHIFAPGFSEEQSRFALAKGTRFETVQTDNGAARLLATLQDAGILGPTDLAVRDLKAETAGIANKKAAMHRAMVLTDDILRRKAAGDPSAPQVVLQAALAIPLGSGESACVRPDILAARNEESMYRPGDVKSYAFMHHLTEQQDVGQAAAPDRRLRRGSQAAPRVPRHPASNPGRWGHRDGPPRWTAIRG
jgi:hypothetical protein